jgi:hypothetical protein
VQTLRDAEGAPLVNIPAHVALAASLMLGGVEEQSEDARPRIDLRGDLHAKQREVWDAVDKARADRSLRRIRILWGRRTGKSNVVIRIACVAAKDTPDGVVPYISITRKHAKINFWKLFKRTARRLDPACKINESDLTIDFPGGGMVWLGGADKIDELDKYRASMCPLAVVDEMQRFPSDSILYLLEEVIEPALFDTGGPLLESGTPGKVKVKGIYWFDVTGDHVAEDVFRANVYDNPFLPDVETRLAKLRKERGWTDTTPKYVREYLGKWCDDPEGRVFPLTPQNDADALPIVNAKGFPLDARKWRFVIATDVGMVDKTAIAILARHPDLDREFLVKSEKHRAMLPAGLAQRIRAIRANVGDLVPKELAPSLERAPIVMDTGGMGKVHAEEFGRVYALQVIPALKTEKESAVELLRGRVQSAHFAVLTGECNDCLRAEWAVLEFDEKQLLKGRRVMTEHAEDDATHAVLYGHRWLRAHEQDDPALDARTQVQREEDELEAAMLDEYADDGRPAWDR